MKCLAEAIDQARLALLAYCCFPFGKRHSGCFPSEGTKSTVAVRENYLWMTPSTMLCRGGQVSDVVATTDPRVAFEGAHVAVLLGGFPRRPVRKCCYRHEATDNSTHSMSILREII